MAAHMMRRETPRPSLRELAASAGVSVPTLRHYFGARPQVVDAIFEDCLRTGRPGLDAQRQSEKPFAASIADYVHALVRALEVQREVRLGDLFAVGLGEGLLDPAMGPSALRHIIDPTVETLEIRLRGHMARGEMIETDARAAALMLISPLLLGTLHQRQMGGEKCTPLDLNAVSDTITAAFVRAFQAPARPA
jgi:AcrR family transcriptional regulator